MNLVDRLEARTCLGDYNYIFAIKNPKIIGFFFKCILKYMEEPLCTVAHFHKFKAACDMI